MHLRTSHQWCSMKKGVLRNFTKFPGKYLCQSLFSNKVAGLRPATLLKKRLWHWCFPVNFPKFLRTPFLQNTSRRLLLVFSLNNSQYATIISFGNNFWLELFNFTLRIFIFSRSAYIAHELLRVCLLKDHGF